MEKVLAKLKKSGKLKALMFVVWKNNMFLEEKNDR